MTTLHRIAGGAKTAHYKQLWRDRPVPEHYQRMSFNDQRRYEYYRNHAERMYFAGRTLAGDQFASSERHTANRNFQ